MTEYEKLERRLAQTIKLLQSVTLAERQRRFALAEGDFDAAQRVQDEADKRLAALRRLDAEAQALRAKVEAGPLTTAQQERLRKLDDCRRAAAKEAHQASQANQGLVKEFLDEMKRQLGRIQKGRRALHGYTRSVGAEKKHRKILSGEL